MKRLVLLGAGHAHVHVLANLGHKELAGCDITLVSPWHQQIYSGMVPGLIAGHYTIDDCVIELADLLAGSQVQWLQRSIVALDSDQQVCHLDDGTHLGYDLISINTGPVHDRQRLETSMPGARQNALFVRPIEGFVELWPKVCELAQERNLRVSVIGGGAAGIELACAIAHRLPNCAVTLVSGKDPVANNYSESVQGRVRRALRKRRIDIIQETVAEICAGQLRLAGGAFLRCDVPVLAVGAQAAPWLEGSKLALDDNGFIAVDEFQRSTSHANVFAAGDIASRVDRTGARSGVYAVRAGPALSDNLHAALNGAALQPHRPPAKTLNLLSCGNRYAIGSWGAASAEGRWVWYLKNLIDRRFIARYRRSGR